LRYLLELTGTEAEAVKRVEQFGVAGACHVTDAVGQQLRAARRPFDRCEY
jgi:hypothetical protein